MITINGADYYTPQEVAELRGVARNTVTQRCQRGTMNGAIKPGRDWLIPAEGLDKVSLGQEMKYKRRPQKFDLTRFDPEKIYSAAEVIEILGISYVTLYKYIKRGLKGKRAADNYHWRFSGRDVLAFLQG